jgi:hypothetical protein
MKRALLSDIVLQNAIPKNIIKNARVNLLFFKLVKLYESVLFADFRKMAGIKKVAYSEKCHLSKKYFYLLFDVRACF